MRLARLALLGGAVLLTVGLIALYARAAVLDERGFADRATSASGLAAGALGLIAGAAFEPGARGAWRRRAALLLAHPGPPRRRRQALRYS